LIAISILILLITAVAIITIVVRDTFAAGKEAVSVKSIFLLGFLFFQTSSTIFTLLTGETDMLYVENLGPPALIFALLSIIFLSIFLYAYARGWGVVSLAHRPTRTLKASIGGLVGASIVCVSAGFVCRDLIGTTVPVLGVLTFQLSSGMYVASVAFAAWAWFLDTRRITTAVWLVWMVALVTAAFLAVEWSRRGIVSVFLGVAWVGYFVKWRNISRGRFVKWITVLLIVGSVPVVLQSALRGAAQGGAGSQRGTSALGGLAGYAEAFGNLAISDLLAPIMEIAAAQFAGSNSLWLIEECPALQPYMPLHQLYYLSVHPVPRILWENKPGGLGREMVIVGGIQRVGDEHNLGPGIIGHCWVDLWWLSIPIYATILGLAMRYIDERASAFAEIPWILIPLGSATAHIFGIPRGETALFSFNTISAIAGAWLASAIGAYIFGRQTDGEMLTGAEEYNAD
jgi:hypothetical protein